MNTHENNLRDGAEAVERHLSAALSAGRVRAANSLRDQGRALADTARKIPALRLALAGRYVPFFLPGAST